MGDMADVKPWYWGPLQIAGRQIENPCVRHVDWVLRHSVCGGGGCGWLSDWIDILTDRSLSREKLCMQVYVWRYESLRQSAGETEYGM